LDEEKPNNPKQITDVGKNLRARFHFYSPLSLLQASVVAELV